MRKSSSRAFNGTLKALLERIIFDECNLKKRGLAYLIEELAVTGAPTELVKVWGTLHFFPLGSPFCCVDPFCQLGIHTDRLQRICETVRLRLHLQQKVMIDMVETGVRLHAGVEVDNLFTGRSPGLDWYDVDRRDMLGRTALFRAAMRGHEFLVEELLAAGANPELADSRGSQVRQFIREKWPWIDC